MNYEFGFIGCGNMGGALARAARKNLPGEQILLANRGAEKAEALAAELGAVFGSNEEVALSCHYIFLGVKPQKMAGVLSPLAARFRERGDRFILVTMAAGISIAQLQSMAGGHYPVIRIMPNTPAAIGCGMIQYAASENVTAEEIAFFTETMSGAGLLDSLDEALIDAGSAVSGCGPAFADLFIEAWADGGVEIGLPRDKAIMYAAQMLMGSAQLVLESGKHPGALKDAVCSPGGSTIVGVHALEKSGFRGAVMDAVVGAYEKSLAMGKAAAPSSVGTASAPAAEPTKEKSILEKFFSGK